MAKIFDDIFARLEALEERVPAPDPIFERDRHGHPIRPTEANVRQLHHEIEYRRRIEDIEARLANHFLDSPTWDRRSKRYDYVVSTDPAIRGTHLRLSGTDGAYATARARGGNRAILVLTNETFDAVQDFGEFSNAQIQIEGLAGRETRLTAASGASLFSKASANTEPNTGDIIFRNIQLAVNGATLLDIDGAFGTLYFDHVELLCSGQDVIDLPAISPGSSSQDRFLYFTHCLGSGADLIKMNGTVLEGVTIHDCVFTLTNGWINGPGTVLDFNVEGGHYQLGRAIWNLSYDQIIVNGVSIEATAANACFSTGTTSQNEDGMVLTNIIYLTTVDGAVFCDLQTHTVNFNENLVIDNIEGWHRGTDSGNTFITIDTDWVNASVGQFVQSGWTTSYSGPTYAGAHPLLDNNIHTDTALDSVTRGSLIIGNSTPEWDELTVGAAGSLLSSNGTDPSWATNVLIAGYLHVGSTSAPTNTTAGDLTVTRLFVTDAALDSEARLVQVSDTYTPTTGTFNSVFFLTNIDPPALSGTDDYRAFKAEINVRPTENYAGLATGFFMEAEHDSGAFNVGTLRGAFVQALQSVGSTTVTTATGLRTHYGASAGTISTAIGLDVTRGVSSDAGAITTGIGIRIGLSTGVTPTTDIAIQSLGGEHRFVGNVRIGANSSPTVALDVTGAALISSTLGVSSTITATGGTIAAGVADTTGGLLHLYGNATGSNEGGEMRLHLAADHDTNFEYWAIDVNADDLRFFQSSGEIAMALVGASGQPTIEFPSDSSVPGTATASRARFRPLTTGGRELPFFQDPSDYQFTPSEKVLVVYPEPANFTSGATTTGLPTTANAFVHRVEIRYPIHATELIYNVSVAADNADCVMRIALYSHDGADKLIDATDAVGTATGARTVDITDVWLWPGHYYLLVCVSSATGNGSTVTLMQSFNFAVAGGAGEADIGGDLTVTAGAAPSTLDPTALTTPADDRCLAVRINGD